MRPASRTNPHTQLDREGRIYCFSCRSPIEVGNEHSFGGGLVCEMCVRKHYLCSYREEIAERTRGLNTTFRERAMQGFESEIVQPELKYRRLTGSKEAEHIRRIVLRKREQSDASGPSWHSSGIDSQEDSLA